MISYQVVGHPKRLDMAEALAESIGAEISVEDGGGIWDTHMKAFRKGLESGAGHVCVLEDDALPVAGFEDAVAQAVEARPDDLMSLYIGRGRPLSDEVLDGAASRAGAWLRDRALLWGVGVVMPSSAIPGLLQYKPKNEGRTYDNQLGRYWTTTYRKAVYYTWPSLVDHMDTPSIAGSDDTIPRRAHSLGVADDYMTRSVPLRLR